MANKQMHHLKVGADTFEIVDSIARSGISGAPSIVSLSSAMIDTDKLYLYIGSEAGYTSGDWYYYNGTSWVSGGQYGDMQLDTSLTTSGMAADAKSVGDRFNSFATTATAGQTPIADGSGGWQWGEDSTLYEQIGDNFAYIRDYTELGAFSVTDIDATSDNPNRVRSKVFTINALTQIKTIDPTDMFAVYAEDGNGTVTRVANNVNTVTLTDTSLRYRYTGRTTDAGAIPVSKIRNFATRNDRNLNLNNRLRDAIAFTVEGGTLNIVQNGSSVHAESSANIVVISNDGYTRVSAGSSETFTLSLNQNYIVYAENGEVKFLSNREDSPITPKEAGKNRIFIGLVRAGELYTWVSENVLFNGAAPHIMGGGAGQRKGANLMQIFPIYSVLGDSLACGFMNIDGVSVSSANAKAYGNNWTNYLSLRTGRRFNNLAVGGSTTTLWRNTYIGTADVTTSAYIIGLGVNDRRQQVTVGTSSDINTSDYTQDAVSTYGNLDYIVNKLKEFNPYCHIFMLTIPAIEDTYNLATFGSCEQQNGAIRYVAGLYDNVHLIDLHDVSGYASELINGTFIANHFNPISYAVMSTMIEDAINAYMFDNYNLFRTSPYHADGTCEQVSDGGEHDSGDSVPTVVRQALFTLLNNNAFANNAQYSTSLNILQSWATEISEITVSPTTLRMNSSMTEQLIGVTQPAGGLVTWESSDVSVADVDGGLVTSIGNGTCTITARCGGKSATCVVTVAGFASLVSISAVYTQSGTVYNTDSLDSLKSDLVVTGTYSDSTSKTITGYTLSGTLSLGTSTITVAYGGKTTTFNVTVSAEPVDTVVEISQYDKRATYSAGATTPEKANYANATNCGVTKTYDMDSLATVFYPAGILPYEGTTLQNSASLFALDTEGVYVVHINEYLNTGRWAQLASGTLSEFKLRASKGYEYSKIFMNVDTRHLDDSYMYDFATGQVWFAGENTSLYGMTNLSQIVTSINAVYTQNHRVYPDTDLSLLLPDLAVSLNCTDGLTRDMDSDLCTLSGTLTVGTSVLTVTWKTFTTTFNVTVTAGSDTSPDIAVYDCIRVHRSAGYFDEEKANGAITILYDMDTPTTDLSPAGIIPTSGTSVIANAGASLVVYDDTQAPISYVNEYDRWAQDASGTMTEFTQTWTVSEYSYIAFTLDKRYLNTAYMYDKTTGQVWFAGRDTPYYGMSNISEAT